MGWSVYWESIDSVPEAPCTTHTDATTIESIYGAYFDLSSFLLGLGSGSETEKRFRSVSLNSRSYVDRILLMGNSNAGVSTVKS